jgi:hypothetical protein
MLYPGDAARFAVKIRCPKNKQIQIFAGPGLTEDDLRSLARSVNSDLLADSPSGIGSRVLFAQQPVTGLFEVAGHFQIVPAPAEAPQTEEPWVERPFLLKFTFRGSSNPSISAQRRHKQGRLLELFLSAMLGGRIRGRTQSDYCWVSTDPFDPRAVSNVSQTGYSWHPADEADTSFAKKDDIPELRIVPNEEYYGRPVSLPYNPFDVPDLLTAAYGLVTRLAPEDLDKFFRAA